MDQLEAESSADLAAQRDRIFARLKEGKSVTAIEALRDFQCFRLAARIHELRMEGHKIVSMPTSGNFVAYVLTQQVQS